MTLTERLAALAERREAEGIYTDANIIELTRVRIAQMFILLVEVRKDLEKRERDAAQSILLGQVSALLYTLAREGEE